MAATDPQSLLGAGKCYQCAPLSIAQTMKLVLLAQISLAQNPARDVTPQGLINAAKCFACFSYADLGKMMELSLLAQIAS